MGFEPVGFLVVPRVIAAVAMTPLLAVCAGVFGLIGGAVVMLSLGFPLVTYMIQVTSAVTVGDMLGGLGKWFVFGIVVAAIQIVRIVGAVPVALTRGGSKRAALSAAGAVHVIATTEQDLVKEVRRITSGKGARIVFDPVGGPTVVQLTEAMSRLGILFQYGALSSEATPLPLMNVLSKGLTIRGYTLLEITTDPERLGRAKQFINEGLASGKLKPVVAKTFPLDKIVESHRFLESNQQIGKIVVTV
jgi:NADPH:quinone reductase-like Zn-dependent oxidoreductase